MSDNIDNLPIDKENLNHVEHQLLETFFKEKYFFRKILKRIKRIITFIISFFIDN